MFGKICFSISGSMPAALDEGSVPGLGWAGLKAELPKVKINYLLRHSSSGISRYQQTPELQRSSGSLSPGEESFSKQEAGP